MAVEIQHMSSNEVVQSLRSAQFEQLYYQTLSQAERIYEEERARCLRVQLLLLEHENDELREQIDDDGEELQKIESANEELREHTTYLETQYQSVQMELKAQLRDLNRYKTEVDALNAARSDATALLSEKLALSRELTTVKTELEHLKLRSSAEQNLLSQKLALERELSTAHVDLETERRTVQRLKARDKNANSADAALAIEIEELQKELAKERRVAKEAAFKDAARVERIEELERDLSRARRNVEKSTSADAALVDEMEDLKKDLEKEKRKNSKASANDMTLSAEVDELKKELAKAKRETQKAERESLKKSAEWDSQKETLEGKLDAFREKLRATKEQLKESQDQLEQLEQAKFAAAAEATKARLTGANPRKRNVARFDPDMTIGTPGHGGPAKKQRISVNPSDKSTFSITPFLNKTISILPESPEDRSEEKKADEVLDEQLNAALDEVEKLPVIATAGPPAKRAKATTKKAPSAGAKAVKPLQESTNHRANTVVKKPSLPKVVEDEDETEAKEPSKPSKTDRQQENGGEETDPALTTAKTRNPVNKRPTIFDEDEDAAPKKTKKLNLGGLKAGSGGGLGLGLGKMKLGGKSKVLAEFSPLKKDRRAPGLST